MPPPKKLNLNGVRVMIKGGDQPGGSCVRIPPRGEHSVRLQQLPDAVVVEPGERERPVGNDGGYLWRLYTYWRLQERDGGVYLITGGMPVYLYRIFQNRSVFPGSEWPLAGRTYRRGDCPVAEAAFDRWITMNIYEHYTETDIAEMAHGIGKVAYHLAGC